jgi:predicted DNA-binding transcriptional regulator YafY
MFTGAEGEVVASTPELLEDGLATTVNEVVTNTRGPDMRQRLELAIKTIVICLATLALMLPVSWVYMSARSTRSHNQSIVQTLMILPLIVAGIILVVSNSLALAFSLAGVVSVLRFRTTPSDMRDIVFIFLGVAVGFAAGVQQLTVAVVLSMIFNFVLLLSWHYDFGRNVLEPTASSVWSGPLGELAHPKNGTGIPDRDLVIALTPMQVENLAKRFDRIRGIVGPRPKKPRYNGILTVTTNDLTDAQDYVERALAKVTKRWKLDGSPFRTVQDGLSVADVAALYLSRTVVESVSGWPLADELRAAFAKIEAALNPRMREFLSTLPQVLSAKAGPRSTGPSARMVDVTRRLFDATRDRRVVEMRYFSAASNRAKTYTVEPYRLTLAQGGVYLVGWVPQYEEFRTFAAERIEKLSVSTQTFKKTRELPDDLFGSSLGVFRGEPERVVVEFDARLVPFVRGRAWHDSQKLEDLADGRLRLTLHVSNDWALRSWLMGFGSGVHVVEPKHLVEAIGQELEDAVARYRASRT